MCLVCLIGFFKIPAAFHMMSKDFSVILLFRKKTSPHLIQVWLVCHVASHDHTVLEEEVIRVPLKRLRGRLF